MKRISTSLLLLMTLLFANCDELLPPGDQTSVDYWADYFLDKYEAERTAPVTEPSPGRIAERRTVLLITGVTIRGEWFDSIAERLQRDGFDTVVYEPPELLSYDLFDATADLAAVVEQVVAESGQERIDILAECTGGLIARHYIQSMGGDEYVARMVTFVSPQNGIDKAPMAAFIAGWPALYDLSPGSEFLRAVNDVPLPENVAFTSIYTCGDEYIQPWETSIIPGATNIGLCDEFVGHFQTLYDPAIYEIMYRSLIAETATDPAVSLESDSVIEEPEEPGDTPEDEGDETSDPTGDGPDEEGSPEGSDGDDGSDPTVSEWTGEDGEEEALEQPAILDSGAEADSDEAGAESAGVVSVDGSVDEDAVAGCAAAGGRAPLSPLFALLAVCCVLGRTPRRARTGRPA